MQKCLNCDSQISCSCKRRHASDRKLVCVNCIALYEKTLLEQKKAKEEEESQKDNKTHT